MTRAESERPDQNGHQAPERDFGRRQSSAPGGDENAKPRRNKAGGRRHQGRVLALQLLYELDLAQHDLDEVLPRTFETQASSAAMRAHVERLIRGVIEQRAEIDPFIASAAPAFPIQQLPVIDRNVLRLAIYELLHEPDVPPRAVINEAVELAKQYGGDNSARFVNGVLGTVMGQLPPRSAEGAGDQPED